MSNLMIGDGTICAGRIDGGFQIERSEGRFA